MSLEQTPHRTLIATMGFDERHVLPSLRLLPYDRLVLVGGRDAFKSAGFRWLKGLEPGLRSIAVDPFDFEGSLESVRSAIRASVQKGAVRISASGGTKILTSAAILAAFLEGIEAWYCDPDPIRLPVLRGVKVTDAFSPAERAIVRLVRGPALHEHLVTAAIARGFARRTVLEAIRSLAAKALVDLVSAAGEVTVQPSPRFALFRAHFREVPKRPKSMEPLST